MTVEVVIEVQYDHTRHFQFTVLYFTFPLAGRLTNLQQLPSVYNCALINEYLVLAHLECNLINIGLFQWLPACFRSKHKADVENEYLKQTASQKVSERSHVRRRFKVFYMAVFTFSLQPPEGHLKETLIYSDYSFNIIPITLADYQVTNLSTARQPLFKCSFLPPCLTVTSCHTSQPECN